MTKYITIDTFTDTQDEGVSYPIGALYPREGYEPSEERIRALETGDNAKGGALIKAITELPAKSSDAEVTEEGEKPKKTTKRTKKADDTAVVEE